MIVWRRAGLVLALAGLLLGAPGVRADLYVDFFRAVNVDNVSGVRSALERGLDPNVLDERGQCALYLAVREDNPQVFELLLTWPGIRLDQRNAVGETPLMMAALKGQIERMQRLMDRGAAIHQEAWSPIHYAATGPSVAAVKLLLDKGAPVDARSANGSTPLMMAARYGDERSVKLLVERGADLAARNNLGLDAVAFAQGADRDWMVETLERLRRQRAGAAR
ncbi:ankyrin repeat domain-containing protein [Ideonella sp. 4Y11]|uniref:Ankyrin repeat domain-containing protein n=1 Tax=Ideonella aquatica TaxID=2824119 RepID=A0A941BJD5_9BURK|nr:ankyrin repeat domain-containing protein [Ideonella aquatica]MBQ0959427.1 ankyrin repeat domain-containing protein [Ideonella aquatica]